MKRVGFILKVKQEKLAEYRRRHSQVWPEMLAALNRAGWHNYSIFTRPDGLLFGYVEVEEDFETALAKMEQEEVNSRWQKEMSEFFELPEGALPDQSMVPLEEIFHLD
jgi:L-rhamnose mutarotase